MSDLIGVFVAFTFERHDRAGSLVAQQREFVALLGKRF